MKYHVFLIAALLPGPVFSLYAAEVEPEQRTVENKPLAVTICMILIILRMKVLSEKRKELSQTIASLLCTFGKGGDSDAEAR